MPPAQISAPPAEVSVPIEVDVRTSNLPDISIPGGVSGGRSGRGRRRAPRVLHRWGCAPQRRLPMRSRIRGIRAVVGRPGASAGAGGVVPLEAAPLAAVQPQAQVARGGGCRRCRRRCRRQAGWVPAGVVRPAVRPVGSAGGAADGGAPAGGCSRWWCSVGGVSRGGGCPGRWRRPGRRWCSRGWRCPRRRCCTRGGGCPGRWWCRGWRCPRRRCCTRRWWCSGSARCSAGVPRWCSVDGNSAGCRHRCLPAPVQR